MSTLIESNTQQLNETRVRRPPRLLLVAYNFPPVGGAGVQRPVKWVKHLRRLGWDVTVLTTENPSVPTRDESLLADIPDDVPVIRARTWEPDYRTKQGLVSKSRAKRPGLIARVISAIKGALKHFVKLALQPDPQVLWVPNAIQAGKRILSELSHDAILVTAPAYSSFFIGTALKRKFGLPLVLDFRDEWDMSGRYLENASRDTFSRIIQDWMQNSVLKQADAVVATTMASRANLAEKLLRLKRSATRTSTIYNGFDEEDFAAESEHSTTTHSAELAATAGQSHARKPFRLVYTGTLWNLTTIEPLVSAVLKLHQTNPKLVSRLELVCVGRKTPEQTAILERLRTVGCRLELIDYCPHSQMLHWLRTTDAVCLLLSDVPGAERVVPAKLFEYLANRKQMLAIVPPGETADIVNRFFPSGHFEPNNTDGIANWLNNRLTADVTASSAIPCDTGISEYSRISQTQRLVALLEDLVEARAAHGGNSCC